VGQPPGPEPAVPAAETQSPYPPGAPGEALVQELQWVHNMIRGDLRTVRQLAAGVDAGRPAEEIRAGLRTLAAGGPLWQLKINCLQYCHFVHSHHHLESAALFPGLRRVNPALGPVVDKLEADHLSISGRLNAVETAASTLGETEDPAAREQLSQALLQLSDELLAHLRYEEQEISGTLRTLSRWPLW
jgi:hypothetical protein